MIFEDYYALSEVQGWRIETDISWDEINTSKAKSQPEVLQQLRDACLIEAYHPVGTGKLMQMMSDDVDATSILSIELYEGFKHFYVLKRYLEIVLINNPITDEELVTMRKKTLKLLEKNKYNLTQELINFIFTEHFAAYYFLRISQKAKEPVLKLIATYIARDEFRHTQGAYDLLKARIESKREEVDTVLEATYNFKHYGNNVVSEVPVFQKNDMHAINTFIKKIERLTGKRLIDYVKKKIK